MPHGAGMTTWLGLVTLVTTLTQATPASYAGVWTAEIQGNTYVRLELQSTPSGLTGQLALGNLEFDRDGSVAYAQPAGAVHPITDLAVTNSALSFIHQSGDDGDRFELRLLDDGRAQLVFLPTPELIEELAF